MKTYEDLLAIGEDDTQKEGFISGAIYDYKNSDFYKTAKDSYEYYRKQNVAILNYIKLLYTLSGEAVPDNYSANYKLMNCFFPMFIKQEVSYLLSNGVTFSDDNTKEKLGGTRFDVALNRVAKASLWGGVAYGYLNYDHIDVFNALEFIPLWGEEDGLLHAGIRFFRVSKNKPLRATLYEEDGCTEYRWVNNVCEVITPKTPYRAIEKSTKAFGVEDIMWQNYKSFPIVPLWGNEEHQSELVGLREKIDCYDLVQSAFASDLDDASQIYWTIENAGGMDDIDLKKFIERMRTVKASVVDDDGSRAEAHTIEVPYNARMEMLNNLRDSIFRDAMALDTDKIANGNITATAIRATYSLLDLKCDDFEVLIKEFINNLLDLLGIDDNAVLKRSRIINQNEDTQMVLASAQYLDDETILKHLPFISQEEIDNIVISNTREEAERYTEEGEEVG